MSKINNGGTAFPAVKIVAGDNYNSPKQYHMPGMSLRDYFAAKALPAVYATAMEEAKEGSGLFQYDDWRVGLALHAYMMADAMLKAREQ